MTNEEARENSILTQEEINAMVEMRKNGSSHGEIAIVSLRRKDDNVD